MLPSSFRGGTSSQPSQPSLPATEQPLAPPPPPPPGIDTRQVLLSIHASYVTADTHVVLEQQVRGALQVYESLCEDLFQQQQAELLDLYQSIHCTWAEFKSALKDCGYLASLCVLKFICKPSLDCPCEASAVAFTASQFLLAISHESDVLFNTFSVTTWDHRRPVTRTLSALNKTDLRHLARMNLERGEALVAVRDLCFGRSDNAWVFKTRRNDTEAIFTWNARRHHPILDQVMCEVFDYTYNFAEITSVLPRL